MDTPIIIKNLTKKFGDVVAVNDVSLIIEPRSFLTLLGPSGCGKTTLLRCIAGLEDPDEGEIYIGDKLIYSHVKGISVAPGLREVGMVFQNYALWPHMTVFKNMTFALEIQKLTKDEMKKRVEESLAEVKMSGYENRYPREMSGGQQQRIALARMLAYRPKVFLMDEPLSNLDARLRMDMRTELKRLHHISDATTLYVTHDQLEAMTLATKICLINNGVLQQYDAPLDLYKKPVNLFVADFVGNPAINLIDAKGKALADGNLEVSFFKNQKATFIPNSAIDWTANKASVVEGSLIEKENKDSKFKYHVAQIDEEIEDANLVIGDDDYVLAIRPEFLRVEDKGPIHASVYSAMPSGMETTVKFQIGNFLLTGVVFGGIDYKIDQAVNVDVFGKEILIFSRKSGHLIAQGSLKL